jgi:hypothetical protein
MEGTKTLLQSRGSHAISSCLCRNEALFDLPTFRTDILDPVAYIVAFMRCRALKNSNEIYPLTWEFRVEAMGLEPTNLLTASQALYQLSYAPVAKLPRSRMVIRLPHPRPSHQGSRA